MRNLANGWRDTIGLLVVFYCSFVSTRHTQNDERLGIDRLSGPDGARDPPWGFRLEVFAWF